MGYSDTRAYYSAISKDVIQPFVTSRMAPEGLMGSETSHREKVKSRRFSFTRRTEKHGLMYRYHGTVDWWFPRGLGGGGRVKEKISHKHVVQACNEASGGEDDITYTEV